MPIRPFVERNTATNQHAPEFGTSRKGLGLFTLSGWCLVSVEYQPSSVSKTGYVWPWSLALIVCNIAVGLWNDPD